MDNPEPFFFSEEVATEITRAATNSALALLQGQGWTRRELKLAVVVLNPLIRYADPDDGVERAVLAKYEVGRGNDDGEDFEYDEIAISKAEMSWRTGMPSRDVQNNAPYALRVSDTKYAASVVFPGGLIVAASGMESENDEFVCNVVAAAIQARTRLLRAAYIERNPEQVFFE